MASAVHCLLVCLVLLVSPCLGSSSYHTSYTHGGRHYVLRSNSDPREPKQTPTTCSSAHSGPSSSDALPVVHRLSPCSPLGRGARNQQLEKPSVADVLHRDALRLRSLFRERADNDMSAPAPSPTTSPGAGVAVSIESRGDPIKELPGAFQYHIVTGFGTPVQQLTVGFDTTTTGATLLQCKPCAADEPCDHAFNPSASSSIAQIPCGSPDCPLDACSGPSCTLSVSSNISLLGNATFFTDTLTLGPWFFNTVDNFRFACLEAGFRPNDDSSGILDLSRNSHSLASRVAPSSSPDAVAFSYCLPSSPSDVGFLSLGAKKPELEGRTVSYTPLRSSPHDGNLYVVELVGLGLGSVDDLEVPRATIAGGGTVLELHTTFTYLQPQVYAVLRDNFRKSMSEYPVAPPLGSLDTCYNFTALNSFSVPAVTLKFDGGAEVELWMDEMMYFPDPGSYFSVGCLAFVAQQHEDCGAVIGSMAQTTTEVVYDVRGGKVGFVPDRC